MLCPNNNEGIAGLLCRNIRPYNSRNYRIDPNERFCEKRTSRFETKGARNIQEHFGKYLQPHSPIKKITTVQPLSGMPINH